MTIDTLGFARRLQASGFPPEHAEAYATVLLNALGERNRSASAYDTEAHISQLEAAGIPRQLAEAWANALPLAIGECRESMAASARSAMKAAVRVFTPHVDSHDGYWFYLFCVTALLSILFSLP